MLRIGRDQRLMNVCDDEKKRKVLNYFSGSSCPQSCIIASITGSTLIDLADM